MFKAAYRIIGHLLKSSRFLNFTAFFVTACVLIAGWRFSNPEKTDVSFSKSEGIYRSFNETVVFPLRWGESVWKKMINFYETARENEIIRKELEQIPTWAATIESLRKENNELRALIAIAPTPKTDTIVARVVTNPRTVFSQNLLINAGSDLNVRQSAIVTDTYGMAGRVINISPKVSTVLPVRHAASKLAAVVMRNGVKILISGRNLNDPVAEFVSDYSQLRAGDKVVTMGDGIVVPPDIPIGEIIDPNERPVRVRLFAHDSSLDYVRIIQQVAEQQSPPVFVKEPNKEKTYEEVDITDQGPVNE